MLGEEIQALKLEEPLKEDDILEVHGYEGPQWFLKNSKHKAINHLKVHKCCTR